jgi:hypothetical protein
LDPIKIVSVANPMIILVVGKTAMDKINWERRSQGMLIKMEISK